MSNKGVRIRGGPGVLLSVTLLTGCAGTGDVVSVDIRAIPPKVSALQDRQEARGRTVLVQAFEDQRPSQEQLGVRSHLGGGVTVFDAGRRRIADVLAKVLVKYLEERGWAVGGDFPGVTGLAAKPDILITGQLVEFSANARSRFGSTVMKTTLELALKATNTAEGNSITMEVKDVREDTVVWFNPEDIEELVNAMLRESLDELIVHLKRID